jgi:hypothetical protein
MHYVNGLKSFAELLIDHGDDVIVFKEGIQSLSSISGLINFASSAKKLFESGDLPRQEYATLVNAIFTGHSEVQSVYETLGRSTIDVRDVVRLVNSKGDEKECPAAVVAELLLSADANEDGGRNPSPSPSRWDEIKGRMYDVNGASAGARRAGGDGDGGGRVGGITPPPFITPGERLMWEYQSIDVTSSSSPSFFPSSVDVDVDVDDDDSGAALLVEARRDADEAKSMLRLAEEDAARWERELADLKREAGIAEAEAAEKASLESVADAYRAALDAVKDNVEELTAQFERLKSELSDAAAAFVAAARASIELLNEEIDVYKCRIADAVSRLDAVERILAMANDEVERLRGMHDKVMSRMMTATGARELRVLEANTSLEEERLCQRTEADAGTDALRAEFDRSVEDNSKMISVLRAALGKTRRVGGKKIDEIGNGRGEGGSSSAAEVDNVRTRMNEGVANLKSVLKSVQGEMDEKEREVQRGMEGRGETEKLMEEIW